VLSTSGSQIAEQAHLSLAEHFIACCQVDVSIRDSLTYVANRCELAAKTLAVPRLHIEGVLGLFACRTYDGANVMGICLSRQPDCSDIAARLWAFAASRPNSFRPAVDCLASLVLTLDCEAEETRTSLEQFARSLAEVLDAATSKSTFDRLSWLLSRSPAAKRIARDRILEVVRVLVDSTRRS
jgi:hypothetical protein